MVDVERFNAADREQVVSWLTACLDVPRWVEQVGAGRPYADAQTLLATAAGAADPLAEAEVDRALGHHPRLGQRPAGAGVAAEMARREQGAMGDEDDATDAAAIAARLRAGNAAYEERFGHVFLLRAAGRSAPEVLQTLERRLGRTPAQERATTAEQLREIALLRLEGVLTR